MPKSCVYDSLAPKVQKHTVKGNNAYQRTGGKWELNGFKNHLIMTVGQEVRLAQRMEFHSEIFRNIAEICAGSQKMLRSICLRILASMQLRTGTDKVAV